MPEELYNSHDYCLLVDEYEALKLENEELIADKIHLINAAMDGGDKYHYTAHDIAYRDLERKCKALEADYVISNRELLVKQLEIERLEHEIEKCKEANKDAQSRLDDYRQDYAKVVNDLCPTDERHCGCVPILRRENRLISEELADAKDELKHLKLKIWKQLQKVTKL